MDKYSGWSYLRVAAARGHVDVLLFMTEQGVNGDAMNLADPDGVVALHAALPHASAVGLLLDKGADANVLDRDRMTPLMRAVFSEDGSFLESALVLINNGANMNLAGPDGMTPLLSAIRCGHLSIAQAMVEKHCDLEMATVNGGITPLLLAVELYCTGDHPISGDEYLSFVRDCLLEKGVDKNKGDSNGVTALHIAAGKAKATSLTMVELLDKVKVDIDQADKSGKNAVHWAAISGKKPIYNKCLITCLDY